MSDVRVNINKHCRVRLTPLGKEIWFSYWEPFDLDGAMKKRVADDGWLREQLWGVMSVFGSHLRNGGQVPFDTEIIIEAE